VGHDWKIGFVKRPHETGEEDMFEKHAVAGRIKKARETFARPENPRRLRRNAQKS
jgi:hypothetical protein